MVELTGGRAHPDNDISMLRVLMVLEDYGELMFLQTVLKKIGFDVDAIQNPRSFQESVLRMNPDVLVMTASGKRVRGLDLMPQLKKIRGLPRVLMLHAPGAPPEAVADVDLWREAPLSAANLLKAIAELSQLNEQVLLDKFSKLHLSEEEQERERVLKIENIAEPSLNRGENAGNFGVLKDSSLNASDRRDRYAKFLEGPPPEKHGFSVKQVQEQVKALRKEEATADNGDLERERRAFVEHLFKKKA